jgi:hypothetical protein
MTTVWIYVDTSKQVGDRDHFKVFANADAADEWLKDNDPEGVAFEYEVLGGIKWKLGCRSGQIRRPSYDCWLYQQGGQGDLRMV